MLYKDVEDESKRKRSRRKRDFFGCIVAYVVWGFTFWMGTFLIYEISHDFGRHHYHPPTCMSNIKQLGLANWEYVQDFDGTLPLPAHWMEDIQPYTKSMDVFYCTAMPTNRRDVYGYAYNKSLFATYLVAIDAPALTPLVYDSFLLRKNASAPDLTGLLLVPRHPDGANVGYVDGHVKTIGPRAPVPNALVP